MCKRSLKICNSLSSKDNKMKILPTNLSRCDFMQIPNPENYFRRWIRANRAVLHRTAINSFSLKYSSASLQRLERFMLSGIPRGFFSAVLPKTSFYSGLSPRAKSQSNNWHLNSSSTLHLKPLHCHTCPSFPFTAPPCWSPLPRLFFLKLIILSFSYHFRLSIYL